MLSRRLPLRMLFRVQSWLILLLHGAALRNSTALFVQSYYLPLLPPAATTVLVPTTSRSRSPPAAVVSVARRTVTAPATVLLAKQTRQQRQQQRRTSRVSDNKKKNHSNKKPPETEEQRDGAAESRYSFPDGFRPGAEMDVRVVRVEHDYALVRPIDHPYILGKISSYEMSEIEREFDARHMVELGDVYRACIMRLRPDAGRIIFSLRRVRRVLRDDFRPFTVVLFNLHPDMDEGEVQQIMEGHGQVLSVTLNTYSDDPNKPSFVTFLHEDDGIEAIKKWDRAMMPCLLDDNNEPVYRRVRCRRSHRQSYREQLQAHLDSYLSDQMEEWNETLYDRRIRERAEDQLLRHIIPWHYADKETERQTKLLGHVHYLFPEHTVKNDARKKSGLRPDKNIL